MLAKNHVMQVLHKKFSQYDKITLYKEDVHAKKNHAMENHVRRGLAVCFFSIQNFFYKTSSSKC